MAEDPRREFSDADLLEAVSEHSPAGTEEVARTVGATRQGVDRRLKQLAEDGRVQRKQIAKVQVWFIDCS